MSRPRPRPGKIVDKSMLKPVLDPSNPSPVPAVPSPPAVPKPPVASPPPDVAKLPPPADVDVDPPPDETTVWSRDTKSEEGRGSSGRRGDINTDGVRHSSDSARVLGTCDKKILINYF